MTRLDKISITISLASILISVASFVWSFYGVQIYLYFCR